MTIFTGAGTKVSIGPDVLDSVDTQAEFEALTYVLIGGIENVGEFGDQSNPVQFTGVADARVQKLKGSKDAGTLALVMARDPLDPGQQAALAATLTNFNYAVKIELADKPNAAGKNSIFYFRGLFMSDRKNVGTVDNVIRKTVNVGINSAIVEVAAVAG